MNRMDCPVCDSKNTYCDWRTHFGVPDGWTLPEHVDVRVCLDCGFVFYDSPATSDDYDKYYKDKYGFGIFGSGLHEKRLDGLATEIAERFPKRGKIADFGGGDGYLAHRLEEYGFQSVMWDLNDPDPTDCDFIVTSHTLEHLVNLYGCLERFLYALKRRGKVIVEVPDEYACSFQKSPPILDYNWVHINHFAPSQMDLLFSRHGFSKIDGHSTEYICGNSTLAQYCYRAFYEKDGLVGMYFRTRDIIRENLMELKYKLDKVTEPVIVYGCGTIMLQLCRMTNLNIVYFVDDDVKAYPPGSSYNGVPILNKVKSDETILICAMGQKQDILDRIKSNGLKNNVIIIDL